MVLTSTEYICGPETTKLPPGTHTIGGVTTYVDRQTTVVCPVAVTETYDATITSKVVMTTYVCPTPGTYTIGPITTTITETEVVPCEYPTVTSYEPGTYTRPEETITITKTNEVYVCPTYEHVDVTQTVVPVPIETPSTYPVETPVEVASSYPVTTPVVSKPVTYPVVSDVASPYPVTTPVVSKPVTYPVVSDVPKPSTYEVTSTPVKSAPVPVKTPTTLPHGDSGPAWAITYSPYNDDQTCKSADQVKSDMSAIASKGFKNIRLYSSDCGSLDTVIPACESYGIKLILGIFIRDTQCQAEDDMARIMKWAKWDMVEMFVVGNEALFQGFCTAPQLAGYISKIKGELQAAGYDGPVTTTEPLNMIEQHYEVLCPSMDVVSINCHPYFNPDVTADQAGPFLNTQLKRAEGKLYFFQPKTF